MLQGLEKPLLLEVKKHLNKLKRLIMSHTRVGMEDNVRLDKNTLAPSNAALVKRAVELCEKHNRSVANWKEARNLLGL